MIQRFAILAVLLFASASVLAPQDAHAFGSLGRIFHWGRKKPTPPKPPAPTLTCSDLPNGTFQACYFTDMNLSQLKFTQIENEVNHDWGDTSPNALLPADGFSARYSGMFDFEDANYVFTATADDGVRLYIDDTLVIDQWTDHAPQTYTATRDPGNGSHKIVLEYYEDLGGAQVSLKWAKVATPVFSPTKKQIMDTQGDLMIWGGPEFALNCSSGVDPETGIHCAGNRGLENGWVWSLDIPLYTAPRREALYQKILSRGFTHVAIQATRCEPNGSGYHGLYTPPGQDWCNQNGERVNTVLRELHGHGLITWCTGITHNDPPEFGLDTNLCDMVLDDWDNTDQKDCHINAMAQWFPNSWHYVEMPEGAVQPAADSCTPGGLLPSSGGGGAWIREAQKRDPKFIGVALEISYPYGHDANLALLNQFNAFWRDVAQNRFETDTYWKYWDNYGYDESRTYNDWFITNAPWLTGFMSGGTTHAPAVDVGSTGGFAGELDLHQAQLVNMAGGFADWPVTTHIKKLELRSTGVHVELDNGRPDSWPDTADRPGMGPLLYSMGIVLKIGGTWYGSAPIQLWRGLDESGGAIQLQNVDGTGFNQIRSNWFYDNRWAPLNSVNPQAGDLIGFFICAGDCRDANPGYSPVHERSNVVLFNLPNSSETVTLTAP